MFCNCTLVGTKACEHCDSSAKILNILWDDVYPTIYYPKPIKNYTYKVYNFSSGEWYNPETHELVEKKDAKIKRLKDEISKESDKVQKGKNIIEAYATIIGEAKDNIKKLEQELKELEN